MTHRPRLHRDPPTSPPHLNDAIRRAHPMIDSPLGDLISDKIDMAEYRRRVDAKRAREGRPPADWDLDPLSVFPHEPEPLDDLASAWRSCLVRAGLLGLALILVGLVAGLVGRAT